MAMQTQPLLDGDFAALLNGRDGSSSDFMADLAKGSTVRASSSPHEKDLSANDASTRSLGPLGSRTSSEGVKGGTQLDPDFASLMQNTPLQPSGDSTGDLLRKIALGGRAVGEGVIDA